MNLSARFTQSPVENLRYILNYSLDLAPTESILSVSVAITQDAGAATPPLAITGLNVLPGTVLSPTLSGPSQTAAYFASGGVDQGVYQVQFLATSSLGQILEDIVEYTLREKL